MIVPDDIRKSVFFVGTKENGVFVPYGTAFIVVYEQGGFDFVHAVTAEHVVRNLIAANKKVWFRVNLTGNDVGEIEVPQDVWYYDPVATTPSDIAICTLFSAFPIKGGKSIPLDYAAITINGNWSPLATKEFLESKGIGLGQEIAIAGLFRSHYGKQRNFPIIRIGNIAAMLEEPVDTTYGYIDAYLIEARSIGGLSGSPVFINLPVHPEPGAIVRLPGEINRGFYLLGFIHGHFDVQNLKHDSALDAADSKSSDIGNIHSGIGIVIPVEKIIETIKQKDLFDIRAKNIAEHLTSTGAIPDSNV